MYEINNGTPISHICSNATTFTADRADLRNGVEYTVMGGMDDESVAKDFFEFGAWHASTIHPMLNAFSGYGSVRFTKLT